MKPTRKVTRRSFIMQVSGGDAGRGPGMGKGKAGGEVHDHDLIQPAAKGGGGAPPDSDSH